MANRRIFRNEEGVYLGYSSAIMVCTGYLNLLISLQTVVLAKLAKLCNLGTQRGVPTVSRKGRTGFPNFRAARIYEDFVIRARVVAV